MTLCDVIGRLFQGVCKKVAVHHGLFLLGPPKCGYISKNIRKNSHGQYRSKRETTSKHSMERECDVYVLYNYDMCYILLYKIKLFHFQVTLQCNLKYGEA